MPHDKKGGLRYMRKNMWFPIVLILSIILLSTSCRQAIYSKKQTTSSDCVLEIVYKRGQIFYATEPESDDMKLYVFTSAGQPVFDKDGNSVSSAFLKTGQIVDISYDGYILETNPLQLSGISAISIKSNKANSVDFLVTLISGMFPSTKPSENNNWDIIFKGDDFLNAREKHVMEYILRENWIGEQVTISPEQEADTGKGLIQISASNLTETSVDLEIVTKDGSPDSTASTRTIHAVLTDGSWQIK